MFCFRNLNLCIRIQYLVISYSSCEFHLGNSNPHSFIRYMGGITQEKPRTIYKYVVGKYPMKKYGNQIIYVTNDPFLASLPTDILGSCHNWAVQL